MGKNNVGSLRGFAYRAAWLIVACASASGLVCCGEPQVVLPETLGIVTVEPAHGSVGIDVDLTVYVVMSQALDTHLDLSTFFVLLDDADAQELVTTVTLSDDGYTVSIAPDTVLHADTRYRLRIKSGLHAADSSIKDLPADVETVFTTAP